MSNATKTMQRRDDAQFQADMQALSKEAEDRRLNFMKKHGRRRFIAMAISILSLGASAAAFGWYLLVLGDLFHALISMLAAMALAGLVTFWAEGPIKAYTRNYKTSFLPKMAQALGGLEFYPERGIGEKLLSRTGVLPAYDIYRAEDCFRGVYKGAKVMFSEARLYKRKKKEPVFQGIFVLLETAHGLIEGHTILTADKIMAGQSASTRWKSLQPVTISTENLSWNRFLVFSSNPEAAKLLVGERLLKELSEAADIFDNAALTAVLFREKFVFLMIPYAHDMFEASDMFVPVSIRQHAQKCKSEIEKILEVIDVFELYQANKSMQNFATVKSES